MPPRRMRTPPHLPFIDRPTAFAVGLKPIALEAWLTPDWEAAHIEEKRCLMAARAEEVCLVLPGSEAAQLEAAKLVLAATGATHLPQNDSPIAAASALVSDDLVVMEHRAGAWTATAASLCTPTYFSAAQALGSSLAHLHGPVPAGDGFSERIARVFSAIEPDMVLERFNWTVQPTADRFTPRSAPLKALAGQIEDAAALDVMHLRVERQTLRRLPQSGAVLFTIRVSLDPLRAVFGVPGAMAAFASSWAGAPQALRAYKGWACYERLIEAALAQA